MGEHRVRYAVRALALGLVVAHFALLGYVVARRVAYPFDLEWMEGGVVEHVARVLEGKPLYVQPSIAFTPFLYNPLFYWLSAPFAAVAGIDYLPMRLLSVAGTVVSMALLALLVRRDTDSAGAGAVAAGTFAGAFAIGGAWYDVARPDMLLVALLLGAATVARHGESRYRVIVAALLTAAAFLAKQTALAIVPGLTAYFFCSEGSRAATRYAAIALGATALSVLALDLAHHGWYRYYLFEVPASQRLQPGQVVLGLFRGEAVGAMPIAATVAVAVSLLGGQARGKRSFYGLVGCGVFACSMGSRAKEGSYPNDWIPWYAWLSAMLGVGVGGLVRRGHAPSGYGLGALQLALLFYRPTDFIPTEDDAAEGRRVIRALESAPGEVLIPSHPHYARLSGKTPRAHQMALVDVLVSRTDPRGAGARLRAKFARAFQDRRFDLVVIDNRDTFPFEAELEACYRTEPARFARRPDAFWPKTGDRVRPEVLYVPK